MLFENNIKDGCSPIRCPSAQNLPYCGKNGKAFRWDGDPDTKKDRPPVGERSAHLRLFRSFRLISCAFIRLGASIMHLVILYSLSFFLASTNAKYLSQLA